MGKYKLEREIRILTWVAYDSKFKPGIIYSSFERWVNKGITALCTIIDKGKIKSFQKLKEEFGCEDSDKFKKSNQIFLTN